MKVGDPFRVASGEVDGQDAIFKISDGRIKLQIDVAQAMQDANSRWAKTELRPQVLYDVDDPPIFLVRWNRTKREWYYSGKIAYAKGKVDLAWDIMVFVPTSAFLSLFELSDVLMPSIPKFPEPPQAKAEAPFAGVIPGRAPEKRGLQSVVVPTEVRAALHELAEPEPRGVEYGGGIDYEIIRGKPTIERMISFIGDEGTVPGRLFNDFSPDFEILWHTHPSRQYAVPSFGDTAFIHNNPPRAHMIIGLNDILIIEKVRGNIPESRVVQDEGRPMFMSSEMVEQLAIVKGAKGYGSIVTAPWTNQTPQEIADRLRSDEEFMYRQFGWKTTRIPRASHDQIVVDLPIFESLEPKAALALREFMAREPFR